MFRLALLLNKTVAELCDAMSWTEFLYWQAYLELEPPDRDANHRAAAIMAQLTNMSGKSLKDGKSVTPDDFLGVKKQQTAAEQIAFLKGLGNGY